MQSQLVKKLSARQSGRRAPLKVGDMVGFTMGIRRVNGVIVEDRGHIGVGGRRLISIEFHRPYEENPSIIELPENEIERE